MTGDLISVIVPCYNNASYLGKCIDSILAQTYTDIEVIVVDDGSSDDPSAVLAAYSDTRLRKLEVLPHGGVSRARNRGIELAKGKYIVFIDGDDYIAPNHIECLREGLLHADCAMILMSVVREGQVSSISHSDFFANHPVVEKSDYSALLGKELLSSPCNKIYKAEIIVKHNIRFDSRISYAEDLIFNLEYFRHIHTVSLIPQATYFYVNHPDSGTTRLHRHIAYTLQAMTYAAEALLESEVEDDDSLRFLLNKYIWGISNIYHHASRLSGKEKIEEIRTIYRIPLYRKSLAHIRAVPISGLYRQILRLRLSRLTHIAFSLRK